MNGDWLENKLNERFEDFDSDLDLQGAWDELETRRPKKKRRRGAVFIWWLGIALLAFLFSSIFFMQNDKPDEDRNKGVVNQVEEAVASTSSVENQNSVIGKAETATDQVQAIVQEEITEDSKRLKTKTKNTGEQQQAILTTKNIKPFVSNQPTQRQGETVVVFDLPKSEQTISVQIQPSLLKQRQNQIHLNKLVFEKCIGPERFIETKFTLKTIKPIKTTKNAIGLTFAYGLHARKLKGIGPFVQARNDHEKALEAWEASIFYRRQITNSLFLETGLGFMQTTRKFEDSFTEETLVTLPDQLTQINRFPDGTTEEVFETVQAVQRETNSGTYYHRYRQLHLNVLLGFEKPISQSVNYRIVGGLEYAFLMRSSGVAFSLSSNNIRDYADLKDYDYKKSGLLSGLLHLEISKTIAKQQELNLSFIGKASLNNLFDTKRRHEKRYHLLTRIGYMKWF